MKKILFIIVASFVVTFTKAQCTGCTTTISGLNSIGQFVGPGQTLCITSTGTLTGQLTISAGGVVCNQGHIATQNIWNAGGTLKNYGYIDAGGIAVTSAGTFTNFSVMDADSLLITGASSSYVNADTQVSKAFAIAVNATAINTGIIHSVLMYDSIGVFTNNGTINLSGSLGSDYNSNFTNNGNLNVGLDFGNAHSSVFTNNKFITIQRDFLNGSSANFITNCIVNVGRNWYNEATITGAALTSCGGFSITGLSGNIGTIGSASNRVDMCDIGNPFSGIDANSGTIASTTTYCTCLNKCLAIVGINESDNNNSTISLFPNPTNEKLIIKTNFKNTDKEIVALYTVLGEEVNSETLYNDNEIEINTSNLMNGLYYISIKQNNSIVTKKIIVQH